MGSWPGQRRFAADRLMTTLPSVVTLSSSVKVLPGEQVDADRREIVRGGEGEIEQRAGIGIARHGLGSESVAPGPFVEREILHQPDRPHPGQCPKAVHELHVELGIRRRVVERRTLGGDLEREDVLRLVPRVHVAQLPRLRTRSPDPISRTSARAVCATTSASRAQRRRPVTPRPPSRSRVSSCAAPRTAGTSPQARAANRAAPRVKSRVVPLRWTSSSRGMPAGAARRNAGKATQASTTARMPASPATITASAICSRISCPRAAPTARRTARSRWRPSARTRKRFATLAQAMSRTMPTAASSTHSERDRIPSAAGSGAARRPGAAR